MSTKSLAENSPDTPEGEPPRPLKLVEEAAPPLGSTQSSESTKGTSTRTKGSSLGSLKLDWIDQVASDRGTSDAAASAVTRTKDSRAG